MPEQTEKENEQSIKEELHALREENARLLHEIEEGRKVQRITVERIVPPRDYEQTKRRCDALQRENYAYRSIIEHGSITVIEGLVDKYILESKMQLKKIISEVSVTSFSMNTTDEVNKLIEHLDSTRGQLRSLICVQSGGNFIFHPKLRSAQAKAKEICSMMESLDTYTGLTDRKAEELLSTLTSMADFLSEFISEVDGDD